MASDRLDIQQIAELAAEFNERLAALKTSLHPAGFEWYPYDSVGSFFELRGLLTGEWRYLLDLIGEEPVLDLACGDGDVAFFLESLGCRVRAVDFPPTNYNRMAGVRALKSALDSAVEIQELDLDQQFTLEGRYGVAFFLGALYHLKNPFYALETLARHARYCVLSTRVARYTPDGGMNIREAPVAYLLDGGEANADTTNFWVFSETGLRRLLARTNWSPCRFLTLGNTDSSDPASGAGDERAFCLARSRLARGSAQLLEGWHKPEQGGWRWTERRFAVLFHHPGTRLRLHFVLPEPLLRQVGPVTLSAAAECRPLGAGTYAEPGEHIYQAELPPGARRVEFELDKALSPSPSDDRELGIVVAAVELE